MRERVWAKENGDMMAVQIKSGWAVSCELINPPSLPTGLESAREPYYPQYRSDIRFTGEHLMAVSKRLRFEILRRDNHCCRYCGEHASPQVKLTIDHVVPTTLGGSDAPDNLAAACGPCNSGKSATPPDASTVAHVSEDAIRFNRAMALASQRACTEVYETNQYCEYAVDAWVSRFGEHTLPADGEDTFVTFYRHGLPMPVFEDCMEIAHRKQLSDYRVWKYCMGIAWNKLREIQSVARAIRDGVTSGA